MFLLSYIYLVIFIILTFCFLHVVFSNTTELSKKLLKFLSTSLLLSLVLLLQFFSVSIYEYNYFYDATNFIICFVVYTNILYTIAYNGLDSKEHRDYEFYRRVTQFYRFWAIFLSIIYITNSYHELAYSYETIVFDGIEKTSAQYHLLHYIFVLYVFSTVFVHFSILFKKSSVRTRIENNAFLLVSLIVRIIALTTLFNFDLLQRKYNLMFIVVLVEAIIYYAISHKFELNTEINKVKAYILENMVAPIIVIRDDGKIVKYNKNASRIFPSLENRKTEKFNDILEIKKDENFNVLQEKFLHIVDKENMDLFFKVSAKETKTTSNNTAFYLIVFEDVTSIRTIEDDLQKLTSIDQLTGILNRQAFKTISEEILTNAIGTDKIVCVFMLDIDYFKSINDTYGHLIGDEFLISTSKVLAVDLSDFGYIARYGGEEFCGIITADTDEEVFLRLDNLREHVKDTKIKISADEERSVTISIGYVKSNNRNANLDLLFRFADIALYKAKRTGRNKIIKYNSNLDVD